VRLRKMGLPYHKIASAFNVDYSTVAYHLDEKQRLNTLQRAKKALNGKRKPKTDKEKKYAVEYYKDRYHNDPEFRQRVILANSGGKFAVEKNS